MLKQTFSRSARLVSLAGAFALLGIPSWAQQTYCSILLEAFNRNRTVMGPVNTECSWPHTQPFGNWGVDSSFGGRQDGHQFDGWCYEQLWYDSVTNELHFSCEDGWYEWNSCTDDPNYSAPNCTLYNAESCTQQVSTTSTNYHGGAYALLAVDCPYDSDDDDICDTGGCLGLSSLGGITIGGNWMSLWELDKWDDDEHVQTLYFPDIYRPLLGCDIWGCWGEGLSEWVSPESYDDPSGQQLVDAQMAVDLSTGSLIDFGGICAQAAQWFPEYQCN